MAKTRILIYTDTPQTGGMTNQIYLLLKHLDRKVYKPLVVCSSYPALDGWVKQLRRLRIPVTRLRVLHKHDPRHLFGLISVIRAFSPDLLHSHLANPMSNKYLYPVARMYQLPLVTTEHDPQPLRSALKRRLKQRYLDYVDQTIAISHYCKQSLRHQYEIAESDLSVVHNGIEVTPLSRKRRDPLVVAIGELHPRKQPDHIIQMATKCRRIPIGIIGSGYLKQQLRQQITESKLKNIELLGYIPHDQTGDILQHATVFIHTAQAESFGLVLIEAMRAGLPVVAYRAGACPEIVVDGETGYLIKPGDIRGLARAIKRLHRDPRLARRLGAAGYRRAQRLFTIQRCAAETERVYQRSLSELG